MTMTARRVGWLAVALAAVTSACLVAACGGSDPVPVPSGGASWSPMTYPSRSPTASPLSYSKPMPDCQAVARLVPAGLFGNAPAAVYNQSYLPEDDRQSWYCDLGEGTTAQSVWLTVVDVTMERPLSEPFRGHPVSEWLPAKITGNATEWCGTNATLSTWNDQNGRQCASVKGDAQVVVGAAGTTIVRVKVSGDHLTAAAQSTRRAAADELGRAILAALA